MELEKLELFIDGMTCVSCTGAIQKALKSKEGVYDVEVNFSTSKAHLRFDPHLTHKEALLEAVKLAGYHATLEEKSGQQDQAVRGARSRFVRALLLTLPLFAGMFAHLFGFKETVPIWLQMVLSTIVQFWCGWPFYQSTFHAIRARSANMDVLIALGTSAAWGFSVINFFADLGEPYYFEASAGILTIVLLGRYLEVKSKTRATKAIEALLNLQPQVVFKKVGEEFEEVEIAVLEKEDLFRVRPGENVAADGVVIEGESAVDESLVTGESLPVFKEKGTTVYAGTVNTSGTLLVRATSLASDNLISKIAKLVEHAQNSRAPVERLADTVSKYFVPAVLLLSFATLFGWVLLGHEFSRGLIAAVSVLVIACPCAIGLAIPIVIVVATAKASRFGILFKEAEAIEVLGGVKTVVFDKTGTVTEGRFSVQKVLVEDGVEKNDSLQIAASLAQFSTHPLSSAVLNEAKKRGFDIEPVTDFVSYPGKGIRGIKRGVEYTLGSERFAEEQGATVRPEFAEFSEEHAATVLFLVSQKKCLAAFMMQDLILASAPAAVEKLHSLNIKTVMITGDTYRFAKVVAEQLGIDDFHAGVLPQDKARQVKNIKEFSSPVAMVGDGINDAAAIATADVGIAIGSGSDISIEASDVTLIKEDLMNVPCAIQLSRKTMRVAKQNLFLAFIYNVLAIPFAMMGLLSPLIAAVAMSLSSLSVIFNALRLNRYNPR